MVYRKEECIIKVFLTLNHWQIIYRNVILKTNIFITLYYEEDTKWKNMENIFCTQQVSGITSNFFIQFHVKIKRYKYLLLLRSRTQNPPFSF